MPRLAELAGASETSVPPAMRLLRTAGVVRGGREGRLVPHALDDDHLCLLLEVPRNHRRERS